MSTEQEVTATSGDIETPPMSAEAKFFGVKTVIGEQVKTDKDDKEPEVEVIDERAPEDQRPPPIKTDAQSDDLEEYSDKVQKRIKKMTWEKNEERRAKEMAQRERDEAVRFAQQVRDRNQQLQQIITTGEATLVNEISSRAALAIDAARAQHVTALDSEDTEAIIKAQDDVINAKYGQLEANKYRVGYEQRMQQQQYQAQYYQQQQQQPQMPVPQAAVVPKPSNESVAWAEQNPWFHDKTRPDMTALAYGLHEKSRQDGIEVNSDEYFKIIDTGMKKSFPEYFASQQSVAGSGTTTVVAPADRNNGAKPRKIRLKASQVAIAKQLNVPLAEYAKQNAKLEVRGT